MAYRSRHGFTYKGDYAPPRIKPLTDHEIAAQESAYLDWFKTARPGPLRCFSRGWRPFHTDAEKSVDLEFIAEPTAQVVSAADTKVRTRVEDDLGHGVVIRKVQCFSRVARQEWLPDAKKPEGGAWHKFGGRSFFGPERQPKGDGVTLYRVLRDGREIDAFLNKTRARECANRLLETAA